MIDQKADQKHEAHLQKVMFDIWRRESGESNEMWQEHLKNCVGVAMQEALTDRQREILTLYMNGYNQKEIVAMLGINKGAVSRTLHRAVDNLIYCVKYATPRTLHAGSKVKKTLTKIYE